MCARSTLLEAVLPRMPIQKPAGQRANPRTGGHGARTWQKVVTIWPQYDLTPYPVSQNGGSIPPAFILCCKLALARKITAKAIVAIYPMMRRCWQRG